jgi:hypothetical protein
VVECLQQRLARAGHCLDKLEIPLCGCIKRYLFVWVVATDTGHTGEDSHSSPSNIREGSTCRTARNGIFATDVVKSDTLDSRPKLLTKGMACPSRCKRLRIMQCECSANPFLSSCKELIVIAKLGAGEKFGGGEPIDFGQRPFIPIHSSECCHLEPAGGYIKKRQPNPVSRPNSGGKIARIGACRVNKRSWSDDPGDSPLNIAVNVVLFGDCDPVAPLNECLEIRRKIRNWDAGH